MSKYILIKVVNNINRFINKCNKYNIELYNIKYLSKNEIIVKVLVDDLKNIERYNYYSEISIYKKLGKDNIIEKIKKQKILILVFILCIISMYFISNIIVNIEVIHSNKMIRELVKEELEELGLKKYSYKKDFIKLENIRKQILENNKDTLEWISITNIGMNYIIRVEERILDNLNEEDNYCNVISTKDALITNIYGTKGDILVKVNDYVRKDDILISGDLILNEEVKGNVCAKGIIYGRVWYNTNISLKRTYIRKEYTGNKRYNFTINNKILRKNKYNKYDKDYIINNKFFSLYKELEYINKEYKYNEEESIQKALEEIDKKFNSKLGNNGKIINKKILNKYISEDEVNIDVFVVTEEIVSKKVVKEMIENLKE